MSDKKKGAEKEQQKRESSSENRRLSNITKEDFVNWLSDLDKNSGSVAGGKGANLAEMYNLKLPVPPAFVVTAQAYSYFIEKAELDEKIKEILGKIDIEDTEKLEKEAKKIRELIENAEMPKEMQDEILEAYEMLNPDKEILENKSATINKDALAILKRAHEPIFVAVRSSATTEDLAEASFAGQQETFLNIKGKTQLINKIKECFASLFTARAIYYRERKGFSHESSALAVVVQKMINADKSGVIFSHDPIHENDNIVIEAVYGLGEGVVSGKILPDHYVVSRDIKIIDKKIRDKKIALFRNSAGQTEQVTLTAERSNSQVLENYEIKKLTNYAIQLEKHYNKPQDIEFAIESKEIYIVQTRPITTLGKAKEEREKEIEKIKGKLLLKGQAASPGVASGKVKIIISLDELGKIEKGDVLVTKMTNPDMVVTMQKCSAIITDVGGSTSHASIVSREMGIPCVVGTHSATKKLEENQEVTVDGYNGKVYSGELEEEIEEKVEKEAEEKGEEIDVDAGIEPVVATKTKIKVIVDLPNFAERAAKTGCKEIGLTRIEGIIASSEKHPHLFLEENNIKQYEEIIFSGLNKIMQYFDAIWVRTSDIRSDEYQNLEGAPKQKEINPMLGMHGIRAGLKEPEILKVELKALKRLYEKGKQEGGENKKVGVMLPQVISVDEVGQVKKILKEIDFSEIELGVMIETPASVQIIEKLCKEGIDFISFGTNDLTQYTLAVDRGNENVQYLYDEMHPAILSQIAYVIRVCKKYDVETSICGQAGSKKQMVEFLVKNGINSISVNADAAAEISEFVKQLEQGLEEGEQEEKVEEKEEKVKEEEKEEPKEKKAEKTEEAGEIKEIEKEQVEAIDSLEHVEEKIQEKREQVEQEKREKGIIKDEEEKPKELKGKLKPEETVGVLGKEEWSEDVELGFDPFADQSKSEEEIEQVKEEQAEKIEEESEKERESQSENRRLSDEEIEKPDIKEAKEDEVLDIF